jgi:SPFH domain / Band 7 family
MESGLAVTVAILVVVAVLAMAAISSGIRAGRYLPCRPPCRCPRARAVLHHPRRRVDAESRPAYRHARRAGSGNDHPRHVTVKVNAVVYFLVVDPEEAVVQVLDYIRDTALIAQTTLRSILGQSDLDHLLSEREKINQDLQRVIDEQTDAWGVKVTAVEVRDVELPQSMQRAMARQAEAEREKRAKIIHAEGEFNASQQLANAAEVIGSRPAIL